MTINVTFWVICILKYSLWSEGFLEYDLFVTICLKIRLVYCLPGGFAAIQGQQLHLSTHRYGVVGLLKNTQTNIKITTIES